jgi:hypothetical protein
MLYSSWKMRLSARGLTLPWQLVELQEPGPVYLLVSAGGSAAHAAGSAAKKIAPHKMTAHRRGQRFPSDPILIRSLGWSVTPVARTVARARVRISYTARGNLKSTNRKGTISNFLDLRRLIIVYT